MQRGQSTTEYIGLVLACAVLLAGVGLAIGPLDARFIVRSFGGARSHLTPDQRALRSPELRALIDRALPTLVLERDRYGDDDEVPVWTSCRQPRCARFPGAEPVLYVHVVHAAAGPVVELWTYYPDSHTAHLPIAALRGFHRDDWEGLIVRSAAAGTLEARASAHGGFTGSAPWWEDETHERFERAEVERVGHIGGKGGREAKFGCHAAADTGDQHAAADIREEFTTGVGGFQICVLRGLDIRWVMKC